MDDKDIQKMWDVSHKLELSQFVSEEAQEFFNANLDKMKQEIEEGYNYWMTVEKTNIKYY